MAQLFIGVDGGGSRCRARIADHNGAALGETVGGPANVRLGTPAWTTILSVCRDAARAAELGEADLSRMHAGMGLAGVIADSYRKEIEALPHPFASLTVDSDAYAAFLGAHEGRDGAVLILGTGSCGLAVVGGRRHTIGGWGADISDEASGMAIGREAIRRALWAHDGRISKSALTRTIMDLFDGKPERAVEWARTATPADYAAHAPLVFDQAEAGDGTAVRILKAAAHDAEPMIAGLRATGAERISLVGGVAERMTRWLAPTVRDGLVAPSKDALDGAILLARRVAMAGASPP